MGLLDGKVAVVSGAARGQGRAHALRLAREGADIIAIDICADADASAVPSSASTRARRPSKPSLAIVSSERWGGRAPLRPRKDGGGDAAVRSWVRADLADLYGPLNAAVSRRLVERWPFELARSTWTGAWLDPRLAPWGPSAFAGRCSKCRSIPGPALTC